jgi:hypothetical protein
MTALTPTVFLSASFPQPGRAERFPHSDPAELSDAVTAIAREILRRGGRVLCGGHPTITPLLLFVCAEFQYPNALIVYQSKRFFDSIPAETWRLSRDGWGELRFTDRSDDLADDLNTMRTAMLTEEPIIGSVFLGGMAGVRDEHALVSQLAPRVQRVALTGPGGAAATIDDPAGELIGVDRRSRRYPVVAREIVDAFGLRSTGS